MIFEPWSLTLMPRKLLPTGMQCILARSQLDVSVHLKELPCDILDVLLPSLQFTWSTSYTQASKKPQHAIAQDN
jgi:hypothetical protein